MLVSLMSLVSSSSLIVSYVDVVSVQLNGIAKAEQRAKHGYKHAGVQAGTSSLRVQRVRLGLRLTTGNDPVWVLSLF